MLRIIVTGSSGQLGQTLKNLVTNFEGAFFDFKTSRELDITIPQNIEEALKKGNYDYCINCAAYTNVEQAEKSPEIAFEVNAEGVKNLSLSCDRYKVKLIHISTDYVFDGEKTEPYQVGDRTNPINEYGKSKQKGEDYVRRLLDSHYIIRTSWLYSKKYGHNFYRTILKKAKEGADLYITDAQTGCPTNTETLAKFILKEIIFGDKPYGTYHVTDGKPKNWFEFAKEILEENNLAEKINLVLDRNYRTFAKRPKNSVIV